MNEAKFKLLNERTINDLSRLTLEISEIDLLFVAVQQLVNGQLPQFLVPHQDLQRGIDYFNEFLQKKTTQNCSCIVKTCTTIIRTLNLMLFRYGIVLS